MQLLRLAPVVLLLGLAPLAQQGHEIYPSNGGDQVSLMNSPSVGGTPGSPNFAGDLTYNGLPEFATVHPSGQLQLVTLEDVFVASVDWPGAVAASGPDLYDIGIASTSAASAGDPLVPDFFTTGQLTALISLGATGLPHPCVVSPTSTCSGSGACPPGVRGYSVDIDLGLPVAVGANATDVSGTAAVWFLPGGMRYSTSGLVGSCGQGDYVFCGSQSIDEHQALATNVPGASWTEGFQLGGAAPSGPLADSSSRSTSIAFGFEGLLIEPVFEDTSTTGGFAPERGAASLAVSAASGNLRFGARVVGGSHLAGGVVIAAASPGLLPAPFYVLGMPLQIAPVGFFAGMLSAWSGTPPMVGIDQDGDGLVDQAESQTPRIPVPAGAVGDIYLQAFVLASAASEGSTAWRVRFH